MPSLLITDRSHHQEWQYVRIQTLSAGKLGVMLGHWLGDQAEDVNDRELDEPLTAPTKWDEQRVSSCGSKKLSGCDLSAAACARQSQKRATSSLGWTAFAKGNTASTNQEELTSSPAGPALLM
jgi:hypothetical protein